MGYSLPLDYDEPDATWQAISLSGSCATAHDFMIGYVWNAALITGNEHS